MLDGPDRAANGNHGRDGAQPRPPPPAGARRALTPRGGRAGPPRRTAAGSAGIRGSHLTGRDFTDPRWTVSDRSTLRYLTDALADRARDPARADGWTRWTDSAAVHRWLLPSWERLAAASEADGVGFFGQLRTGGEVAFPSDLE